MKQLFLEDIDETYESRSPNNKKQFIIDRVEESKKKGDTYRQLSEERQNQSYFKPL